MSMNNTPSAERVHIGIFGRRNAGKSSVINAMTGQDLAIVSDVKGTTTDPVLKAMELLPLGPVVMIDTPGLDDEGELGALRVQKAYQILNKTDIAVLVMDATLGMTPEDEAILKRIQAKEIPFLLVFNKTDLLTSDTQIQNTDGYRVTSAPNTSITAGPPCTSASSLCFSYAFFNAPSFLSTKSPSRYSALSNLWSNSICLLGLAP